MKSVRTVSATVCRNVHPVIIRLAGGNAMDTHGLAIGHRRDQGCVAFPKNDPKYELECPSGRIGFVVAKPVAD